MTSSSRQFSNHLAALALLTAIVGGIPQSAWAGTPPQVVCAGGTCVPCAPKRITYGYYPTLWRRWPTERTAKPAKSQESLPTPAKESKPITPSDETKPVEETPATPAEPATEPPPAEMAPLFDDNPPAPPKDATPSPEIAPPSELKELPFDEPPAPPAQSGPPAKTSDPPGPGTLDEDPFKDELPGGESPADEAPKKESSHGLPRSREPAAITWRSTNKVEAPAADSASIRVAPAEEEPRLLEAPEASEESGPSLLPRSRNPLRSPARASGEGRVVATAHWSNNEPAASPEAGRRNPLRSN